MVVIFAGPLDIPAEPMGTLLEKNWTFPVIAGPPLCPGVTIAVNVTLEPCEIVLFDDVTEVVVLMVFTVSMKLPLAAA